MRYCLLFIICFIVMPYELLAGNSAPFKKDEASLVFFPEIGINFSRLSNSSSNGRGGVFAGANLRLGNVFFVQGGLKFQNMKYDVTIDQQNNATVVQKSDLWYLNYPLLVGFAPINNDALGLRVFAGATGSLFLGGSVSNSNLSKADFSKAAWSVTGGIGLDVWRLTFNVSYDMGLTDVHSGAGSGTWRTVNAGVGFKFY